MRKSIDIPIWYSKNKITALRKESGFNQTQVADSINCALKTYQNYEQGRNFPTLEYASKLADLYNVSIDYLLGRSDLTQIDNDFISKETGLNEITINELKKAHAEKNNFLKQQNYLELINFLFEHDRTKILMQYMYYYFFGDFKYAGRSNTCDIDLKDNYLNGISIPVENIQAWFLQMISSGMVSIYEKIIEPNQEKYKYYGKYIPTEAELQSMINTYSSLINEQENIIRKLYESNFDKDTISDFQKSCIKNKEILRQVTETKNMLYGEPQEESDNYETT